MRPLLQIGIDMNKKFFFGFLLAVLGSSALGAALFAFIHDSLAARKSKKVTPPSRMSADEMIAMLKAAKIVMDMAQNGAYDHIVDKDAAIRNDFEFYKMTLLIKD